MTTLRNDPTASPAAALTTMASPRAAAGSTEPTVVGNGAKTLVAAEICGRRSPSSQGSGPKLNQHGPARVQGPGGPLFEGRPWRKHAASAGSPKPKRGAAETTST